MLPLIGHRRWEGRLAAIRGFGLAGLLLFSGCNSLLNGWLDPTTVGAFQRSATIDIRSSLSLDEPTSMIPGATMPTPEDLVVHVVEYPISAGDTLAIEINELRQRQTAFQTQVSVSPAGYVNLPVIGRVDAAGLTAPEFQDRLTLALRDRDVLLDPEVTVNPLFIQKATYSIFGVGVSASSNSPLRAGTFPIRRPDLQLLEAINQVGGLNEFVTEVYVFRDENELRRSADSGPAPWGGPPAPTEAPAVPAEPAPSDAPSERTVPQDLLDAAKGAAEPPERKNDDIPAALEPDPAQPYIFLHGEFVENPAFPKDRRESGSAAAAVPATELATPAVDWSRVAGESTFRVLMVSAESLRRGDPLANVVIRAGDVIRIVSGEVGVYYVMGQVNRVGTFAFNSEQVTLKAAIAIAGGLSPLAWPDRCTVYRRLGQREQMLQVNLDRIFAGLDPDFTIQRGDIINVGTHPFAPFLARIRGFTLPTPATTVGYSFTYARNFADIDSFSVRSNPNDRPSRIERLFP